jgi:hypothetical protein
LDRSFLSLVVLQQGIEGDHVAVDISHRRYAQACPFLQLDPDPLRSGNRR